MSYGESSIFSLDFDLISDTDSESSFSIIILRDFYVTLLFEAAKLYEPNPAVANVLFY